MKFDVILPMKKILTLMAIACLSLAANAQMLNVVKFKKLLHDFGSVKEESERVSTVFSFQNISQAPIYITKVETSCGCTTPEYSKDTIMPGDTGYVRAIYETRGRGGDFHKNLFVYFNQKDLFQSLMISGHVIPEANLASKPNHFSTTYSNLAFTTTMAEFPKLYNTQKQSYKMKAYNYMGYPIRIYEVEAPEFLEIDVQDSLIDVNDSITITVTIDGSKIGAFGEIRRRFGLLTDDPAGTTKILHVFANVKEDFSKMTAKEKKLAPIFELEPTGVIDLGKHSAGEKFAYTVTLKNAGKTPLKIHSILPNCSCISVQKNSMTIEAGQTAPLVLTVDTVNQSIANHTKYITIHTNDPNKSEHKLKIIVNITN